MKLSRFLAIVDFISEVASVEAPSIFDGFDEVELYTVLFEATNRLVSSSSSEASMMMVFLPFASPLESVDNKSVDNSLDDGSG